MLKAGYSQKDIAPNVGKDKSVVSRQIKGNADKSSTEYRCDLAHRKCISRLITSQSTSFYSKT